MLMSLPNSVGIDPASANEDGFKASGRLVLPHQEPMIKKGRTVQFVMRDRNGRHVDQLADFRGDRPCQTPWRVHGQRCG